MPHPLTQADRDRLIDLIKSGRPLPKEDLYKLAADEEDVFLFWNGRSEEVTRAVLSFHHIEHIDEPRKEVLAGGANFSMFDQKGRQRAGWENKLIWGDNKLILSSLAHGPLRRQIEAEGGLKLVYIDPPFAVGADFSHTIEIGGESATKTQTVLEEIAYRDTWQRGISSYLSMMYDRLKLIYSLLAEDGSIYVHCDWRVNSYMRFLLDDIFGTYNYVNEIIWKRATTVKGNTGQGSQTFDKNTDSIFLYSRNDKYSFNAQFTPYSEDYLNSFYKYFEEDGRRYRLISMIGPGGASKGNPKYEVMGVTRYWRYSNEKMNSLIDQGLVVQTKKGNVPNRKLYLDDGDGVPVQSLWDDVQGLSAQANERVGYPTQKPEALLERIIRTSSNEGDLVADFFCGSGTTAAVAEKLNRKWIATDLGRFAIHTTRKRLIGVQRELKEAGRDFRAFELLNLGKYERQFFLKDLSEEQRTSRETAYLNLILEAYKAEPLSGGGQLHGRRGGRVVHVGPLDVPVTEARVREVVDDCKRLGYTQVDVLGFEFENGLTPRVIQESAERASVRVRPRYIPKDVFDARAVRKGQVKFYDVSYLKASVSRVKDTAPASAPKKAEAMAVTVTLEDFVTNYTQEDLSEVEASLKKGKSEIVMDGGQIIKVSKDKRGVQDREILTKHWHEWVDYWSMDFDYDSKREIIRLQDESGEVEEQWTGNYIFENEWQSFRTRQDRSLEFTTPPRAYAKPGRYRIMVKVVDILGVDTSQLLEVEV